MTKAIKLLREQRISFEIIEYKHSEKGAVFASRAIGMAVERTIKTLVVELSTKGYLIVLVPGSKTIRFKGLAALYNVKRAAMADAKTAESLTGYKVGGISPFGMKQDLPVAMDAGLLSFNTVAVNGGKRGNMLVMNPTDILRVTGAKPIKL